jgi:hypothetical protein
MESEDFIPAKVRAYLYRVLNAVVPLLVGYGVIEDAKAAIWIGLGAAVLGTGTATAYTSTK